MKKICLWMMVIFLGLASSEAGDTFSEILGSLAGGGGSQEESEKCSSCGVLNTSGAAFCSQCGERMEPQERRRRDHRRRGDEMYCPHCDRSVDTDRTRCVKYCNHCDTRNDPDSAFCSRCGKRLGDGYLFVCPYCKNEFASGEESNESEDRDYRHRRSEERREVRREVPSRPRGGSVQVDSFVKANYDDDVKFYNVSGYTSDRSFSKVVVYVHVTQEWPVIIHTMKVEDKGQWREIPITTRLKEGRNDFGVSVPQGASQLIVAFNHGQGSEVRVCLE